MSVRELGRRLGISASLVSRLVRKGMPMEEDGARAWRLTYVRSRQRSGENSPPPTDSSKAKAPVSGENSPREAKIIDFEDPSVSGGLDATLTRLRELECVTSQRLKRLLKHGAISEVIALRQQHAAMIRHLFDAEAKALKLREEREELISVERALGMINSSFSELLIVLRRLPDLAKSPEQKSALESFLAGCLGAMKRGAENGFQKSGTAAASVAEQGGQ